jgi:hypothetical protein
MVPIKFLKSVPLIFYRSTRVGYLAGRFSVEVVRYGTVHCFTDTNTLSFLSELTKTVFELQNPQFFPAKSLLPIPLQCLPFIGCPVSSPDRRLCLLFAYVQKCTSTKASNLK